MSRSRGQKQRLWSRLQVGLIIFVCLIIIGIEGIIIRTYLLIAEATAIYEKTGFLSSALANVQREVLRLQVETHMALGEDFKGDLSAVDKQRGLLNNQIRLTKSQSDLPPDITDQLNAVNNQLQIYDILINQLRDTPLTAKQVKAVRNQLDQILTKIEKEVKNIYDAQETHFFFNLRQALGAQSSSQKLLIGLNVIIILTILSLIFSVNRSVGNEFEVAYRQLETEMIERRRAEMELRHQNYYLAALHETTLGMVSRLNLTDLLEDIMERAGQLVETGHGFMALINADQNLMEIQVGMGLYKNHLALKFKRGEGLAGQVWQTAQPLKIDDYDNWTGRMSDFPYQVIQAIVGIPLKSGEQVIGVLGLVYSHESPQQFSESQIELLTRFAQLATIAIDNARLYSTAQTARLTAEAANQAKSDFLANVSHELRTPLTSVLGFAKIIQKRFDHIIYPTLPLQSAKIGRASQQIKENLQIIVSEGERLTELINNVLDLAKIEAGQVEWHMQPLAMSEIIERATAATASLFSQKPITLLTDISPDLPLILGDKDKLIQVVINLISNAVKFTEKGQVTCQIRGQAAELLIKVIDTGIGIAPENQPLVFEKFKQVGDTLTDKPAGTGLGLPICKEIIEHHQGRLWVESELGVGSQFCFTLPILPPQN